MDGLCQALHHYLPLFCWENAIIHILRTKKLKHRRLITWFFYSDPNSNPGVRVNKSILKRDFNLIESYPVTLVFSAITCPTFFEASVTSF